MVVGAGKVALRKVQGLLEAGACVTVVAPRWQPEFERLPLQLLRRPFEPGDLAGATLVFSATDDRAVNHAVAEEAHRRDIAANIADAKEECDFLVPARITRGALQIAVSTGGQSPRVAAELRRTIEAAMDAIYSDPGGTS